MFVCMNFNFMAFLHLIFKKMYYRAGVEPSSYWPAQRTKVLLPTQ